MQNINSAGYKVLMDFISNDIPRDRKKFKTACHMCGLGGCNTGKIIFEGNPNEIWEGAHFEFPICTDCFMQLLAETTEQVDRLFLQKEIEEEKAAEKEWLERDPSW